MCAAGGEIVGDGGADAGSAAGEDADFAVEEAGGGVCGALEVGFEEVEDDERKDGFDEEGEVRDRCKAGTEYGGDQRDRHRIGVALRTGGSLAWGELEAVFGM